MKSPNSTLPLRRWHKHPVQFVRDVLGVTPDPWQAEILEAFPHRQRLAMKACKGPGKTAVEAWLAWNFLLTRIEPKVAAVSITAENLADNLWAEMAKWQQRSPVLKAGFEWTKTRIFCKTSPETWWMSARQLVEDRRSRPARQYARRLACRSRAVHSRRIRRHSRGGNGRRRGGTRLM